MAKKPRPITVQEAGRLGGQLGGPARARALTAEQRHEIAHKAGLARAAKGSSLTRKQRSEIARKAALARWDKKP